MDQFGLLQGHVKINGICGLKIIWKIFYYK